MMNRFRWTLPLALLVAVGAGTPRHASAASCVDKYNQCLNDSWETSGIVRVMADLDCFADYVGCVRRKV